MNEATERELSRRGFVGGALSAAGLAALAPLLEACGGSGGGASGSSKLAALIYGGPVANVATDMVLPYLKNHGISASITTATSIESAILAQEPNPKFDIFAGSPTLAPRFPNAYTKLDTAKIANISKVYPSLLKATSGIAIPSYIHSETIVYNSKRFGSTPPTLQDFADSKFKGRVVVQATPYLSLATPLYWKYLGGDANHMDAVYAWWKKVVPNLLTTYTQVTQPAQMFQTDQIDLAVWYSGRAAQVKATNPDAAINWVRDPALALISSLAIPPHSHNTSGAYEYMNRWLDPDVQGTMAKKAFFGPVTSDANIPESVAKTLPVYGPQQIAALITPDWVALGTTPETWEAKFNAILQGG